MVSGHPAHAHFHVIGSVGGVGRHTQAQQSGVRGLRSAQQLEGGKETVVSATISFSAVQKSSSLTGMAALAGFKHDLEPIV